MNQTRATWSFGMRRIVAGLLPTAVIAAAVVTGPSAGATVRAKAHHDRAQLTAQTHAHRSLLVRPPAAGGQPAAQASSSRQVAGVRPSLTIVSHVTGPALMFTDSSATGPMPLVRDLATGGNLYPSASPGYCVIEPRLSPDGNTEVMVGFVGGNPALCNGATSVLYKVALTGQITTLATAPANAFFDLPNWSPDGSNILYTMEQDDSHGQFVSTALYTVPAAGGSPTAVPGAGVNAWDGVYSPDGTKIVAATDFSSSTANYLAVMNSDGTSPVVLTGTEVSEYSPNLPAWSPDGSKLSYQYIKVAGTYYNAGLAVINADGTGDRILPVTAAASTLAGVSSWSADGSELYYSAYTSSTSTGKASTPPTIYATDPAGTYRTTVVAGTSSDYIYDPMFVGPGPSTGSASTYSPITPVRVLPQTTLGAGTTRTVQITGVGSVPPGASAVTLNLTGVTPTKATFLQVYPGPAVPNTSNLNLAAGQIAAVAVQATLSPSGTVTIRNAVGVTGVIVDVSGYFSPDTAHAGYVPLPQPVRALNTTLAAHSSASLTVTGLTGAPANAVAVVLNLTASTPTASTWLAVTPTLPSPGPVPTVSNLNLPAGAIRANLVTVKIGDAGRVSVFNKFGSTHTIVDVAGFYVAGAGLAYYPLTPTRVLDTRYANNTWMGSAAPIGAGRTYNFRLGETTTTSVGIVTAPASAAAIVFNLTAVAPTASTFLTVYADPPNTVPPNTPPTASNLNAAPGTIVPNLVIAKLATSRLIGIYNRFGSTAVVADLSGYYA
jgi:hypothetical protein